MLGVIPRSFSYLFEAASRDETIKNLKVTVEIVEIYRGKLRDLLEPKDPKKKHEDKVLKLREVDDVIPGKKGRGRGRGRGRGGRGRGKKGKKGKKKKEKPIPKTTEIIGQAAGSEGTFKATAASVQDILQLLSKATKNRTKNQTDMNKSSSRSHLVLRAKAIQDKSDGSIVHANLCFCDLAGSEKVRKTNVVGKQLEEAKDINKQLTALRNVIDAIVKKKKFVAFKDAMLTRVLQHSLVGNVKTTVLICASPHAWNQAETLSALTFGSRCKLIKNKVVANKDISKEELLKRISALEKENETLKKKVAGHKMKDLVNFMKTSTTLGVPKNKKSKNSGKMGSGRKSKMMTEEQATILKLEAELTNMKEELRHAHSQLKQSQLDHHMSHDNTSANDEILGHELNMLMEHVKDPMAQEILTSIMSKFDVTPNANLLSPTSPIRRISFPQITTSFEDNKGSDFSKLSEADLANFRRLDTLMTERSLSPIQRARGALRNVTSKSSAAIGLEYQAELRKKDTIKQMMRLPSDGVLDMKILESEKMRLRKETGFLQGWAARICDEEEYVNAHTPNMLYSEVTETEVDLDVTDAPSAVFSDADTTDVTSIILSDVEEEEEVEARDTRMRKGTLIVAEPDGGLIEIDEDGNETPILVADFKPKLKGRKEKKGQPMMSDPVLDLVENLSEENIKELRTLLRSARREKGFELNFNTLVTRLDSWRVADIASFWVILSCQQQKKVRLVHAIGFVSRLDQYLEKKFAASDIIEELGDHAKQFRLVLSTVPEMKFSEIDLDGNDQITLDEMTRHLHETQRLVVEKLFMALDEDQNGFIDRMEFDVLKQSLQKDFSRDIDENQKRFDMSNLFNEYVGNLTDVYAKKGFADENGGLTVKGASHVLHLLRDQAPSGKPMDVCLLLENDLGLLYLQGLTEVQITDLMKDVPRQIWSQLVETVVE